MNKKIIKNNVLLSTLTCALCLPMTVSYAQNLWANMMTKPVIAPAAKHPVHHAIKQVSLLARDSSSEQITTYSYTDGSATNGTNDTPAGMLTTTATTQIYGSDPALANSAARTKKVAVDQYAGCTSIQYHGIGNKDTLVKNCDALQRPTSTVNTEFDLTGTAHTSSEHITYTLQGDTSTVKVEHSSEKYANGTVYTTYTQTSPDKKIQWTNTPHVDFSSSQKIVEDPTKIANGYGYTEHDLNDLGQEYQVSTHLPAALADASSFITQETKTFDAQGRATQTISKQTLEVYARDNTPSMKAARQITTQTMDYDDVNNQVSSKQTGIFADANDNQVAGTKKITSPVKTQYFNDQQKVTRETLSAASPNFNGMNATTAALTNTMTYDNLGQKTSTSTAAATANLLGDAAATIHAKSTFNALGLEQSATMGSKDDGSANPMMKVEFTYADLNNKMTTKSVQKGGSDPLFRYNYVYGASGEVLREYRGIIKTDDLSQAIHQDTLYSNGGYDMEQRAWTGAGLKADDNANTVINEQLGDVNNKPEVLKETITNGSKSITISNTYDYNTGKLLSTVKKVTSGSSNTSVTSSTSMQYFADGRIHSITDTDTAGKRKTSLSRYVTRDSIATKGSKALDLGRLLFQTDFANVATYNYYHGSEISSRDLVANGNNMLARVRTYHDALGKLTEKVRDSINNSHWTSIDKIQYGYNDPLGLNRLTDIAYDDAATVSGEPVVGHIHYTYETTTNNVKTKTETLSDKSEPTITTYTYEDNSNQLSSSTVDHGTGTNPLSDTPKTTRYVRDALGNVLSLNDKQLNYSKDGLDRYLGANNENIYDSQGNLTNTANDVTFTWNIANHEASYTDANSDVTKYSYPTYGRKKSQTMKGETTSTDMSDYYLGGQLVNEFQSGSDHNGSYSAYLGRDVRIVFDSDGNVQQRQFLRADKTGTMKATLVVDSNGGISGNQYNYNAEGSQLGGGKADGNKLDINYEPLRFNGDMHDQETDTTDKTAKVLGGTDYKLARSVIHMDGITRFMSDDYGQKLMNRQVVDNGNMVSYRDAGGHNALSGFLSVMNSRAFLIASMATIGTDALALSIFGGFRMKECGKFMNAGATVSLYATALSAGLLLISSFVKDRVAKRDLLIASTVFGGVGGLCEVVGAGYTQVFEPIGPKKVPIHMRSGYSNEGAIRSVCRSLRREETSFFKVERGVYEQEAKAEAEKAGSEFRPNYSTPVGSEEKMQEGLLYYTDGTRSMNAEEREKEDERVQTECVFNKITGQIRKHNNINSGISAVFVSWAILTVTAASYKLVQKIY